MAPPGASGLSPPHQKLSKNWMLCVTLRKRSLEGAFYSTPPRLDLRGQDARTLSVTFGDGTAHVLRGGPPGAT